MKQNTLNKKCSKNKGLEAVLSHIDAKTFFEDLFYALNKYDRFYSFEIKNSAAKILLDQLSFGSVKTLIITAKDVIELFNTHSASCKIVFIRLKTYAGTKNYYTLMKKDAHS